MGIILWIIFGALAGWIASMIVGTDQQQGALMNIVVGIVGALIGGFIMSLRSFLVAILGSVVLLVIVKAFGGMHHHSSI
jgi:uncharacterized membrane protein YeaQ/YmgE (transglycosylase-associated protein family)